MKVLETLGFTLASKAELGDLVIMDVSGYRGIGDKEQSEDSTGIMLVWRLE